MSLAEPADTEALQEREYFFPYHYLDLLPRYAYRFASTRSYRRIVRGIVIAGGARVVLDAGCGDGRFCYELSGDGLAVTGVDCSQRALGFARIFCPQARFELCDLTKDSPAGNFDTIVLMEVLEHFDPPKIERVLTNLQSCLADEGRFIVTVPSTRCRLIPKHYQHFTPESLTDALSGHFDVVSILGHLRTGLRYRLYRALLLGDAVLGALRGRVPGVRLYYDLIDRLLSSVELSAPDRAARLIAVCRHKTDRLGGGE